VKRWCHPPRHALTAFARAFRYADTPLDPADCHHYNDMRQPFHSKRGLHPFPKKRGPKPRPDSRDGGVNCGVLGIRESRNGVGVMPWCVNSGNAGC